MIFKTIENKDSDGNVIDTQVVSFMKARKIAQDELNKSLAEQSAQLEIDAEELGNLERLVKEGLPYEKAHAQAIKESSVAAKEHAIETKGAAGSTEVFVTKQKAAQAELKATTTATKGASIAMKALSIAGNMIAMWAISEAISLVIKGIDNLVHASEKAIERMNEAKSKISELNTAHESHAKLVKESGDRYIELSNKMDSLTTDELEEFNELNKQFTEAFPELITGFDNQGNAIANIGTNAEESRKKLQELLEQEEKTANYEIFKNLNDLYAGTKVKLDEAIKSQKEYDNSISKANEKLKNTEGFTEFDDSISITLDYKNNGAQIRNNLMNLLDEFKRTLHEDYDDYSLDQELINTAIAIDNGTFDEYTGEQNVWFSLVNWTPEQKSLFKQMLQDDSIEVTSAIKNELENVGGALRDEIGNLTQENEKAQQEAESAWRDYTNNLANAMQSQQTFKDIGDEGLQDIAIAMVRGLDRSLYEEGQNINYDWIRNNILNGLKNLDDDAKFDVKMAYQQLLTLDPNDITPENQLAIENIINELARLLDKDPIQIRLAFGFDENGLQTQYAQTMRKAYAKFGGDQYDDKGFVTGDTELDKFAKDNSIKTKEEVEFWNKCIEESATREEAMQKYLNQNPDKTDISYNFKDFWNSIGNTEKATDLKEELFKLASSGELTGSKLKSLAESNELLKSAMDSTGLSANKLAEKIRELNIDNIESDIKSFADALDKVKNKQSLTTEETAKLIAKDNSLAGAVKKTKDGYLLEKDALEKVVNSHKEKYNVAVSYEINETKKVIDRIKDRIDAYQKEIDALKEVSKARDDLGGTKSGSYSDTLAQLELEKKLEKDKKKYDKRQKKLKELMNSLNNIDTSSTSNSSDSNSKSSKVFDYIQIKIARLERLHSKYLDKASDGTKTLTERTKNYNKVLSITERQINAQDKAIARYNKQLKKIGLDESIAKKIRDGAFDIDTLKGKKKDKAEKYQDIWEKKLDAQDKKADLKAGIPETERNMYQAELDDLENKRKAEEAISDELKNQIEQKEKIGDKNTSSDYSAVNESILKQINNYKEQIPVLEKQLGTVKKGSDKWYEYKEAIDSVKDSISGLTQEMMDNATKGIEAIQNASDEYLKSLDDEDTLNNAKKENATSAAEKNTYIDNTIKNIQKRKDKYTQDSLDYLNEKNNSANLIKSTSKKVRKSQGAVFDSILSFVNSGQKIPEDILNQVTDANLLTNCYAYNSAITAYETNEATRKLYNETSKSDIRNAVIDKVNNINDEYDVKNATLDREEANIQQDIAEKEANGVGKSVKDYRKLIEIDEQRKKNAIDRRSKLEELLNTEIELGHIVKNENDPAYKAFMSSIASCDEEISNCTVSQINYNKAIREMNVENYKTAISLLDSMIDKYKRLQSLADVHNSKLSDEDILAQIGLNDEKITENNKYLSILKDNIKTYLTDELHMSAENVEEFINLMENSPHKLRGFMNDLGFKDFNEKTFPDLINNLNEFNSTMNDSNALMVEQENLWDSLAQKRIDSLNEYLEALKKQQDYKDRIFAIEKAQYDLEKAKNNLTKKVWDGQQWVYTADTEAVQSAQEALDNTKFDEFNNSIQDLIDVLEKFIKDFNIYDDFGNMINNPEVILKKGVLGEYTIVDIDKIFTDKVLDTSKLSRLMSNIQYAIPNVSIPNINLPDIQSRAMNQTVNYDKIELILPNITDASTGADLAKSFVNELKNLPSYAKQYDWNR